jgi:hypothetical protein
MKVQYLHYVLFGSSLTASVCEILATDAGNGSLPWHVGAGVFLMIATVAGAVSKSILAQVPKTS